MRYGSKYELKGPIQIYGSLPVFKLPGSSKITLGKMVILNSDADHSNTALTFNCTLVCGIEGKIEIGDNTCLNGVSITAYKKVTIGKNCQIASCTFIADTDFHPVDANIREREAIGYRIDYNKVAKGEVNIADNVWIGWGCIILKGVTIGNNSIVAAGSVVIDDVPPNVLVAGNPASIKKEMKF